MLDVIRNNRKYMLLVLVVLVIPAFAFFGVSSYSNSPKLDTGLAEVKGQVIEIAHLEDRMKRAEDPTVFERNPKEKLKLLNEMVALSIWETLAAEQRLVVSDAGLQRALLQVLDAWGVDYKDANGKFDSQKYNEAVTSRGYSVQGFENMVRNNEMSRRATMAIGNAFTSKIDAQQFSQILDSQYITKIKEFTFNAYNVDIKVSAEEENKYYQDNQAQFTEPAYMTVEYVVFDAETLAEQINITDEEAKAYFDKNIQAAAATEERRISHIMLGNKEQAAEVAQTLKKDPTQFAALAKEKSIDDGTADAGGDLGYISLKDEASLLRPLAVAAFALKEGEVSEPIQSSTGYHVVMFTDIRAAAGFDEMKESIKTKLRSEKANIEASKMVNVFNQKVLEERRGYEKLVQDIGLKVQTAAGITQKPSQGAPTVLMHEGLLVKLFSKEAIEKGENIAPVNVSPTQLVSARVAEHTPAKVKPFDEVRSTIIGIIVKQKGQEQAKVSAENELKEWVASPDKANDQQGYSFNEAGLAQALDQVQAGSFDINNIYALSEKMLIAEKTMENARTMTLPASFLVEMPNKGYTLVQLQRIDMADAKSNPELLRTRLGQAGSINLEAQGNAYIAFIEKEYKVKLYPDVLEKLGLSAADIPSAP